MKQGRIFFLCVFAVSCAGEVHVLSQEDLLEKPLIANRGPFSETEKKRRRRRKKVSRPFPEDRTALTGKVDYFTASPSSENSKAPEPPKEEGLFSSAPPPQFLRPDPAPPPPVPLLTLPPRLSLSAVSAPPAQTFAGFEKKQEVKITAS